MFSLITMKHYCGIFEKLVKHHPKMFFALSARKKWCILFLSTLSL